MTYYSTISDELKHSAAHVLAMAVSEIYPDVRIGVGPVTKSGFYYDFDISEEISQDTVSQIYAKIKEIEEQNLPFQQIILDKSAAQTMLMQRGQMYKAELLNIIPDTEVSFYKTGEDFIDLCRGPHVNSTGEVGPILITKIEEVYWNEDPSRPKLKRIHGVTFRTEDEMKDYEKLQKLKKERDFTKISIQEGFFAKNNNKIITLTDKGALIMDRFRKAIFKNVLSESSIELPLFFIPRNAEEISIASDIAAFSTSRSSIDYPLELFTFTPCVNLKVKDEKQPCVNTFFYKSYQKDTNLIQSLDKIEKILRSLLIDFPKIYVDLEFNNPEDSTFNSISKILHKCLISHTKVISEENQAIILNIKARDSIDRDWDIATIKVFVDSKLTSNNIEVYMVEYFLNMLNLTAFHIEDSNGSMTKDTAPYEVVIIPLKKKHMNYSIELRDNIISEGFSAKILNTNISLHNRIKISESSNALVTAVIGDSEIENKTINARINKINHGLMKMDDLFKFLAKSER